MSWLTLLLAIGATARLARLFTIDVFPPTKALRFRIYRLGADRFVTGKDFSTDAEANAAMQRIRDWWPVKLSTCPWCLSIWIAAVVAPLAYLYGTSPWFIVSALLLTASHVAGLVSGD